MSDNGWPEISEDERSSQSASRRLSQRIRSLAADDYEPIGFGTLLNALARELRVHHGRIQLEEDDEDQDDDEAFDDDSDDNVYSRPPYLSRAMSSRNMFPPVQEPVQAGKELQLSGEFGNVQHNLSQHSYERNLARSIFDLPGKGRLSRQHVLANLLPNTNGTAVAACDSNIYTAQFSADSSFYYTCSQDFHLRIYDTTAGILPRPVQPDLLARSVYGAHVRTKLHLKHTIIGHPGRWTITDTNLSPDNERIIYSSITPIVYMANTRDPAAPQIPISFSDNGHDHGGWADLFDNSFGIWSCRFSADGNEVVAGGAGKIFVYDLLANRRTVKISAHHDDVNSCCWADASSGNVLISASDDTFLKVWDRRSLGSSQKPSGVLVGHTEGITYVSAKGDGRYVLSNGKDQAARLWDLRKMCSSADWERFSGANYSVPGFDYRYSRYPKLKVKEHPKNCSVMTYRGHTVLRTLIRCHFSPAETTGSQYLYSGSSDGRIHIWSLDGRVVQVLDRSKTLPDSHDPSAPELLRVTPDRVGPCVRDVSWHTQQPILMSAAWEADYGRSGSIVAQHEWKGLSKMGGKLEDWVSKHNEEQRDPRRSRRFIPGSFPLNDDEEDDEDEDEDATYVP